MSDHGTTPTSVTPAALTTTDGGRTSERFLVRLRGGTFLRLKAGRGEGHAFDKLLALLDESEIWQAPEDWDAEEDTGLGRWIAGEKSIAGACVEPAGHGTEIAGISAGANRTGNDENRTAKL